MAKAWAGEVAATATARRGHSCELHACLKKSHAVVCRSFLQPIPRGGLEARLCGNRRQRRAFQAHTPGEAAVQNESVYISLELLPARLLEDAGRVVVWCMTWREEGRHHNRRFLLLVAAVAAASCRCRRQAGKSVDDKAVWQLLSQEDQELGRGAGAVGELELLQQS